MRIKEIKKMNEKDWDKVSVAFGDNSVKKLFVAETGYRFSHLMILATDHGQLLQPMTKEEVLELAIKAQKAALETE